MRKENLQENPGDREQTRVYAPAVSHRSTEANQT